MEATRARHRASSGRQRPEPSTLRRSDDRHGSTPANGDGLDAASRRYDLLVLGSLQAALTMFVSQAAASVLVANSTGSTVDVSFAAGFIPHVAVNATSSNLLALNTWPPALAVTCTSAGVLWNLWRRRDEPMFVLGWGTGLLMSLNLLLIQFLRHLLEPPMLSPWIYAQTVAIVLAVTLMFVAFKPKMTNERTPATVPVRSKTQRTNRPRQ